MHIKCWFWLCLIYGFSRFPTVAPCFLLEWGISKHWRVDHFETDPITHDRERAPSAANWNILKSGFRNMPGNDVCGYLFSRLSCMPGISSNNFFHRRLVISNHFVCKDLVHHPIETTIDFNGWPSGHGCISVKIPCFIGVRHFMLGCRLLLSSRIRKQTHVLLLICLWRHPADFRFQTPWNLWNRLFVWRFFIYSEKPWGFDIFFATVFTLELLLRLLAHMAMSTKAPCNLWNTKVSIVQRERSGQGWVGGGFLDICISMDRNDASPRLKN